MVFYTGKPDRPIEHYGVVCHSYQQTSGFQGMAIRGIARVVTSILTNVRRDVVHQSDAEALQSLELVILGKI